MSSILKNILAVVVGLVVGSVINMAIITFGGLLVPPPEGADVTTMEGLKVSMHLFQPKHFLMPFLAHALGTLVGSVLTIFIASTYKQTFAYVIGGLFLIGGVMNVFMLPSPLWFSVLDIVVAYLPMSFLALKILGKNPLPTKLN